MMHEAAFILMRLFRLIACVMAYHRSTVMMVNVNTDRWLANTVKNPATRQPAPVILRKKEKFQLDPLDECNFICLSC